MESLHVTVKPCMEIIGHGLGIDDNDDEDEDDDDDFSSKFRG